MRTDTLRRALWTTLWAAGASWILFRLGAPRVAAAVASVAVLAVSHYYSGTLTLARTRAVQVRPNHPSSSSLYRACIDAVGGTVALPRLYVTSAMSRAAVAGGYSRFNPSVVVHTDLLDENRYEDLVAALRYELLAVRSRLPWHGTVSAACLHVLALIWLGP